MSNSTIVAANFIDVDPGRQQELVEFVQEAADTIFAKLPGFKAATVLTSLDGTRVVSVGLWESMEAVQDVQGNPDVADYVPRLAEIGTSNVTLFRQVSTHQPGS
jgi:quinol monooxygenase YgiN